MQEKNRRNDSDSPSKKSEKQTFAANQAGDPKAGKAKSLQDCSFLDTPADNKEDSVRYQPEHSSYCTEAEPVGKPNEFYHLLGSFCKEGFLRAGDRRLGVGTEGSINFCSNGIEELCGLDLNVELGHRSETNLGRLLEEGKMNVGYIIVLSLVGFDDACHVNIDAYCFKLVASLEIPALRAARRGRGPIG